MTRICLFGLIAGGQSGVPRYTVALTRGLDSVADEFPDISLRLLTTPRGAEQTGTERIATDLVRSRFREANAGPLRVVAEQVQALTADADLLHFFDLTGPLTRRRPFVTTIHDAAIKHRFEGIGVTHKRVLQPWALRHAAATVAVSGFARDEAVDRFGADPHRIHVIHSGPGLIAPATNGSDLAAPSADPYLLYVGNLALHKNLPFLIEAFGRAEVEARLLLVGQRGERFDDVRRAAAASPKRDRIEIRRDATDAEIETLYAGASMLLLPSRYEGFGFTALEAMARGCPVLASDVPALREVSGDGAMLLPLDDTAAWADAMRRVFRDQDIAADLRRRGAESVRRYSWEETARSVCELFRRTAVAS